MSTSISTTVADAIKDSLNAQVFVPAATAVRAYQPVFDLATVGDSLRLSVIPRGVLVSASSRSACFFDVSTDIGVQKKIDPNDPTVIDSLLGLVEQIGDHLRLKRLATYTDAQWLSSEHEPILAAEHLERQSVFTSVLTVTHRVTR